MVENVDEVVTQLREILKLVPKPDKLNNHPWVECLLVKHHVADSRLLEKRRPGYQLASALGTIFMALRPERPPESQKEKSRLNARWARFGTLGAYFVPLLINSSAPAPVTVLDIGARINDTLIELVTGRTADEADEGQRTKYRLIPVSEHTSDVPVSRSTLNDWLQQGLTELAGRVLQREEELSFKDDHASPLLACFKKDPATSPSLEETHPNDTDIVAPLAVEPPAPILALAPSTAEAEQTRASKREAPDLQNISLDHYLIVDWWVKESLQRAAPENDDNGLLEKARRLAEFMAAIELQIEAGPDPTPRLVYRNVRRAMRGIGIEPEHDKTGDLLIALLQRAQILVLIDNRWEFTNPNLVDYFGARYISEYGQHWVSLQPRHRRLMQWAAACLARRGDDERVKTFITDLRVLLNHTAELSWLEAGEVMVEFSSNRSTVVNELRCQLIEALHRLSAIKSAHLKHAVDDIGRRLGVDIGLSNFDASVEEIISEAEMEQAANQTGLAGLLLALGMSAPALVRVEDAQIVRALLEHLQTPGGHLKLPCAAWLRRSSLQTRVSFYLNLKTLWNSGLISALEAVADIAIDERQDAFTRMLARSILTRDDFILHLWASSPAYQPLVYTLLIALDKRLFFRTDAHEWQVVE